MITPADDYLIHQTPHTFDTVGTSDRNFYDRYFFNGYRKDGSVFFAVAMGLYPNLGVIDAAFSVIADGRRQQFIRASGALGADRMDTRVGPISVKILEPHRRLRLEVAPNPWAITADLVLETRSLPVEEPHFFRRDRGVIVQDYTRVTQHAGWSGALSVDGAAFNLTEEGGWWGARDHSWGIRGVGNRPAAARPPSRPPQFFWNWAPLNFPDLCTLYTVSEHEDGSRWHEDGAVLTPFPDATVTECRSVDHALTFEPGTRHINGGVIRLQPVGREQMTIEISPLYHFLMQGIGYGHPTWGHGMWVGPEEVTGGEYDLSAENPMSHPHVQTVARVKAGAREGVGVFEHIVLGPHQKYGFRDLSDPAR